MSKAGPMEPWTRGTHYGARDPEHGDWNGKLTPVQRRRYVHKMNRNKRLSVPWQDFAKNHPTPRRKDARTAMLERRRGYEDLEAAWQAGATLEELR